MYEIRYESKFKKDFKRIKKRGYDTELLQKILATLRAGEELKECHKDHSLIGNYIGYRECHIKPNWLLIYKIDTEHNTLELTRTGTHSDLFD